MKRRIVGEAAMMAMGARLAACCRAGTTIFLRGELGAGKTTLVRGFLRARGHEGAVKSPTYTLVEPYEFTDVNIYHFDLYRLSDPLGLDDIGVRDYFDAQSICLVEWPEQGEGMLPAPDLLIEIAYDAEARWLEFTAGSDAGNETINCLA